jgi:SAM-dependent methyltransferase
MPTIPSEQVPDPPASHQARQVAESFGADAERYDRARPGYPAAMVDRIVTASPGPDLLDVGCGTGIAARLFQAAGCRVLGVDPDARMAELARRSGLDVEVSTIEAWDSAGREFDAAIAGQAWHWVDPVAGAAKAARVLRPGGRLAVFWNAAQVPDGLAAAFGEVYREVQPGLPFNPWARSALDTYQTMGRTAADGMCQSGGFGEPETWQFDWERPYTRDEWVDQLPTFGGHNLMAPDKLAGLLAGIGAAVDKAGGGFTMHYTTVVVTAVRTGLAA